MITKKNNKSPLRYPGGKTRACKILDEIFNEYYDVKSFDSIISPFFGGGSFEFFIQNKYSYKIIANDKFHPLADFWKTCKNNNNELCCELFKQINKIDKKIFQEHRDTIMEETDILQKSMKYFIINRCSFSGATLSGGFSKEASKKRFTISSIERIKKLNLDKFEIYNSDYYNFIECNYKKNNFIFLDPPYYLEKKSKLYGKNGDMHENFNHNKLFNCISKLDNWILTYNNCDFIKKLYKNFKIIETSWSYGMNKSKKSSEIIILSNKM